MSVIALLTINSTASAGPKLYSFDVFFQESQNRLNRLKVTRVPIPVPAVPKVISDAAVAADLRRKPHLQSAQKKERSIFSEFIVGAWLHDPGERNIESDSLDFNIEIVFTPISQMNPIFHVSAA